MKRPFALFALLSLSLVSVVHCKKKQAVEDAGPEPTAEPSSTEAPPSEPPPSKPAPLASNADDIARFGEETKLADVQATVTAASVVARESPPNGPQVAVLPKGTVVTQIAQREHYVLATFANPKNASETLMGWMFAPSLGGAAVPTTVVKTDGGAVVKVDAGAPKPPTSCAAGLTLVMVDEPTCAKICAEDKECPTGQACKGSANKIVNGKAGDGVTTCVPFHPHTPHDAGAPTPAKDASAPPAVVDAGAAPIPTIPEVPAIGGKCAPTYVFVAKSGRCHKDCSSGPGACTGSARCTKHCGTPGPVCTLAATTCPPP
jgi:hypothetical protein